VKLVQTELSADSNDTWLEHCWVCNLWYVVWTLWDQVALCFLASM